MSSTKQSAAAGRREKQLRVQKEQVAAQLRRAQARDKRQHKSRDTRKKVLLGVLLLEWMQRDELLRLRVQAELDKSLVRPVDRAVFALEAV